MNLSKRLNCIIDMVPQCDTVADIGTDHGFVPISLVESGKAKRAVASDIVAGPVERAKAHVEEHQLSEKIDVRMGPGLSTLKCGEADCIIICGMGGMLVAEILQKDFEIAKSAKSLILSPHTEIASLRKFLSEYGFSIVDEQMVAEEDKFYTVMRATYCGTTAARVLNDRELTFGPVLLEKRSEVFLEYLQKQREKTEKILDGLRVAAAKDASEHIDRAIKEKEEELSEIDDILAGKG